MPPLICFGVALFTRAWIEMLVGVAVAAQTEGRPLHEGVD
ncbi:hypothetical protein EUBSIR_01898 [[Eubacterium] siraeum DSM 15702]|uniref:Uncharacterized protein n=1 Tax=[Eubacterium] siraeum DSM 15702 TaxID=428128 RepID=B0MPU5_9FIRM|nr:hypothetical protein EUBSIR_01898 [[Eubacterium] siraeum DSM 15702]